MAMLRVWKQGGGAKWGAGGGKIKWLPLCTTPTPTTPARKHTIRYRVHIAVISRSSITDRYKGWDVILLGPIMWQIRKKKNSGDIPSNLTLIPLCWGSQGLCAVLMSWTTNIQCHFIHLVSEEFNLWCIFSSLSLEDYHLWFINIVFAYYRWNRDVFYGISFPLRKRIRTEYIKSRGLTSKNENYTIKNRIEADIL